MDDRLIVMTSQDSPGTCQVCAQGLQEVACGPLLVLLETQGLPRCPCHPFLLPPIHQMKRRVGPLTILAQTKESPRAVLTMCHAAMQDHLNRTLS